MIPWLPEAVRAFVLAWPFEQQRLHARPPPFMDPSLSFPLPFLQDSVPAPQLISGLPSLSAALTGCPPSFMTAGHRCRNQQCLIVVSSAVSGAKNMP